jgi:hypothetical protein
MRLKIAPPSICRTSHSSDYKSFLKILLSCMIHADLFYSVNFHAINMCDRSCLGQDSAIDAQFSCLYAWRACFWIILGCFYQNGDTWASRVVWKDFTDNFIAGNAMVSWSYLATLDSDRWVAKRKRQKRGRWTLCRGSKVWNRYMHRVRHVHLWHFEFAGCIDLGLLIPFLIDVWSKDCCLL